MTDDANFILNVLRDIRELEQARGLNRETFPVVVFRPKDRPPDLAKLLSGWVAEFRGQLRWRLEYHQSGPGINWVLAPERLWDFAGERGLGSATRTVEEILSREEPDLVLRAHEDLLRLAAHLADRWKAHRAENGRN